MPNNYTQHNTYHLCSNKVLNKKNDLPRHVYEIPNCMSAVKYVNFMGPTSYKEKKKTIYVAKKRTRFIKLSSKVATLEHYTEVKNQKNKSTLQANGFHYT